MKRTTKMLITAAGVLILAISGIVRIEAFRGYDPALAATVYGLVMGLSGFLIVWPWTSKKPKAARPIGGAVLPNPAAESVSVSESRSQGNAEPTRKRAAWIGLAVGLVVLIALGIPTEIVGHEGRPQSALDRVYEALWDVVPLRPDSPQMWDPWNTAERANIEPLAVVYWLEDHVMETRPVFRLWAYGFLTCLTWFLRVPIGRLAISVGTSIKHRV
jgi:hypothetical protein